MNKLITILAITATLVVIVFATLDQREGLWHKTSTNKATTEVADTTTVATDTTTSGALLIEVEPLVDTTIINI